MHNPSFLWHENGAFHYLWSLTTLIPILNKDNIILKCFEIPLTCFFLVVYVNYLKYDMHIPHMYTHTLIPIHIWLWSWLFSVVTPGDPRQGWHWRVEEVLIYFLHGCSSPTHNLQSGLPWTSERLPFFLLKFQFLSASNFYKSYIFLKYFINVFPKKRAFGNPGSNLEKEWSYLLTSWF